MPLTPQSRSKKLLSDVDPSLSTSTDLRSIKVESQLPNGEAMTAVISGNRDDLGSNGLINNVYEKLTVPVVATGNGQADGTTTFPSDDPPSPGGEGIYIQMLRDTISIRRRNSRWKNRDHPVGEKTAAAYALELLENILLEPRGEIEKRYKFDIDDFKYLMENLDVHMVSCSKSETGIKCEEQFLSFKDAWVQHFKKDPTELNYPHPHPNGHIFVINYRSLVLHAAGDGWTNILLTFAILFTAFGLKWTPFVFVSCIEPTLFTGNRAGEDHLTRGIAVALNEGVAENDDNVLTGDDVFFFTGKRQRILKINLTDIYKPRGDAKIAFRENVTLMYSREYQLESESPRWDALVLLGCQEIPWKSWTKEQLRESLQSGHRANFYTNPLSISFRRALVSESAKEKLETALDIPWVIRRLGQSILDTHFTNAEIISNYIRGIIANPDQRRINNITLLEELSELSLRIPAHNQRVKDYVIISKRAPWPSPLYSLSDTSDIMELWQNVEVHTDKLRLHLTSMMTISETRQMRRLTILAAIFIPLSFVGTCFGMNVREIVGSELNLWLFFAVSIPLTLFSVALTSFWELAMYQLVRAYELGYEIGVFIWDLFWVLYRLWWRRFMIWIGPR